MTEEEELTLMRFAAIRAGHMQGVLHFAAMHKHILADLSITDFVEMVGDNPNPGTLKRVAASLAKIDRGEQLATLEDIPKFLRMERVTEG